MKTKITILIVGPTVYQTIVLSSISDNRKLITPTRIIIYGDFPVTQIQLITVTETCF